MVPLGRVPSALALRKGNFVTSPTDHALIAGERSRALRSVG